MFHKGIETMISESRAAKRITIICVTAVAFILYLLLYVHPPYRYPSTYNFNFKEAAHPCFGHFHLCAIRNFITHHKLYGNTTLSTVPDADIYDFSAISRFSTDFFKNRTLPIRCSSGRDERFTTITEMRVYIGDTYKDAWLISNMKNVDLTTKDKKGDAVPYCSFQPLNHFNYSFHHKAVIASTNNTPARWIFSVHETLLGAVLLDMILKTIHAEVTTWQTRASCETKDYVDGKYIIDCLLLEPHFQIYIRGFYRAPSSLMFKCTTKDSWNLLTVTSSMLHDQGIGVIGNYRHNGMSCSNKPVPSHETRGFWVQRNGVWHWSCNHCYFNLSFDGEIKQCLHKWKIMFFGDSHSFYRHFALCTKGIVNNNTSNTRTLTPSDMAETLRRLDAKITSFASVVLVLNCGHWNLAFVDISTYVSTMLEVFDVIRALQKRDMPPKIIWIESTAMPYDEFHWRWRLNPVLGAMNDWVNHNMRKLGVSIVPAFDISLTMNDQTKDGSHYHELYQDAYDSKNRGMVSVGRALNSVLFNLICSTINH